MLTFTNMEIVIGILGLALVAAVVFAMRLYNKLALKNGEVGHLSAQLQEGERQRSALTADVASGAEKLDTLRRELSESKAESARLSERLKITEQERITMQQEAETRFKLLANEIFANESQKFKQSSETRLDEILKPLRDNIETFRKTVVENYSKEADARLLLTQHLKDLMELNASIGKDARNLTEALKGDSKVQGDWGEMILDSILQKSGLEKGVNYFVQETRNEDGELIRDKDGRQLRPDVVVCLPDKKCIVIDSKVSLTAYANYVNADTEEERKSFGQAHVASVRAHLKELDMKKYQDYVGMDADSRIDYVLMFIPNENAYITAMTLDRELWQEAYDKRVVIISPAHVISTLRLVSQLWSRDKQTKNSLKIAEESGKLYDKFVGFLDDMKSIDDSLTKTRTAYDNALKKLSTGRGNLISRAESLRKLGAKASKSLPASLSAPVEEDDTDE